MRWRIRAFVFRDDFVKYPNTLKGKGHTSPSALLRGGLRRCGVGQKYASLLMALRASHLELFLKAVLNRQG